jgi:hypothetical protein
MLVAFDAVGGNVDVLSDFLWVKEEYFERGIRTIQRNFNSIDKYFRDGLNLTNSQIDRIKNYLQ